MSRSLVGSSSSSTFGSPISRRMSCRRRRSPPERSRTSVRAFVAAEAEAVAQHPGGDLLAVAEHRAAADLLQRLEHPQVARDLGGVLREVGDAHGRAAVDRRRPSGSTSPASSLTSVVLPDPLTPTRPRRSPGPRRHVTCSSTRLSPKRDAHVDGVEHLVAQPRGGEAQQLGAVAELGLVGDQLVRGGDAELRLRRARRRPAAQPRELLADQLLAAVLAGRGLAVALGAGEHVGRVAALVLVDLGVGDLPRRGAHGVQEPAVVGDDEHRPAARREVAREPVDALDVEVVGGLVEQQQLGGVEQQPGERDAPPLAARQRRDLGVDPLRRSGSARRRRAGRRARCETRRRPPTRGRRASPTSASRTVRSPSRSSPWPSSARSSVPTRVIAPASGCSRPGDQPQQRRLPVAVAPDDADPLALGDAERHVGQHRAAAVALGDVLEVDEVAGYGRQRTVAGEQAATGRQWRSAPHRADDRAEPPARLTTSGWPSMFCTKWSLRSATTCTWSLESPASSSCILVHRRANRWGSGDGEVSHSWAWRPAVTTASGRWPRLVMVAPSAHSPQVHAVRHGRRERAARRRGLQRGQIASVRLSWSRPTASTSTTPRTLSGCARRTGAQAGRRRSARRRRDRAAGGGGGDEALQVGELVAARRGRRVARRCCPGRPGRRRRSASSGRSRAEPCSSWSCCRQSPPRGSPSACPIPRSRDRGCAHRRSGRADPRRRQGSFAASSTSWPCSAARRSPPARRLPREPRAAGASRPKSGPSAARPQAYDA